MTGCIHIYALTNTSPFKTTGEEEEKEAGEYPGKQFNPET